MIIQGSLGFMNVSSVRHLISPEQSASQSCTVKTRKGKEVTRGNSGMNCIKIAPSISVLSSGVQRDQTSVFSFADIVQETDASVKVTQDGHGSFKFVCQ